MRQQRHLKMTARITGRACVAINELISRLLFIAFLLVTFKKYTSIICTLIFIVSRYLLTVGVIFICGIFGGATLAGGVLFSNVYLLLQ